MKGFPGKICIFGQYKTGTTGLFTLLRNSLPADTRTLFEPLAYVPEELDDGRWVLAKTILKEPGHPEPVDYASFLGFDRRLCISRDPRDWLVSAALFNWQVKESVIADGKAMAWIFDYLRRKEENPGQLPLKRLLEFILSAPPAITLECFGERSQRRHAFCIEFQRGIEENVFPIRYEDFVDGHLSALEAYLEIPLRGSTQVDRAYEHVPRTLSHGNWKDWLTQEDVAFFRPYFDEYIRHHGYDPDWSPRANPRIDPAHATRYVDRIMQLNRCR